MPMFCPEIDWRTLFFVVLKGCFLSAPLVFVLEIPLLLLVVLLRRQGVAYKVRQGIRLLYRKKPLYILLLCAQFLLVYLLAAVVCLYVYISRFDYLLKI